MPSDIEHFKNFETTCNVSDTTKRAFDELDNIISSNNKYIIPCEYNTCEKQIKTYENTRGNKIYIIDGCDIIGSKLQLWRAIRDKWLSEANKIMPTTFILNDEINDFKNHYKIVKQQNPNFMFVLKNYKQRQEGIKLVSELKDIENAYKDGFYLVQDYLYNPFLINKRKINMRYYLIVVCRNKGIEGYIYNDGFMYYTPDFYDPNKLNFNAHITTGYIDRKVYDENPLTHQDFRKYLLDNKYDVSTFDNNVIKLMNKVMFSLESKLCKNNKLDQNIRFELFGVDVAPLANLDTYIIEINKGPDVGAKDERDKLLKINMQKGIFKIIENLPDSGYIKVY